MNENPYKGNYKLYGEEEAIDTVIRFGKLYGYGNLIWNLKQAWKFELMEAYNISEEDAEKSVNI